MVRHNPSEVFQRARAASNFSGGIRRRTNEMDAKKLEVDVGNAASSNFSSLMNIKSMNTVRQVCCHKTRALDIAFTKAGSPQAGSVEFRVEEPGVRLEVRSVESHS